MHLHIALVDDLEQDMNRLEQDLALLARGRFELTCERFGSGEALLSRFARGAFDLIFMDIRMDGMNGIEAAKAVRQADARCLIVFLTTSQDFAWQSFPVHPFDYLLKPYTPSRLEGVLKDALRALDTPEPEIEVRVSRRTLSLPLGRIYYAVAQNHFVSIATSEGEYRSLSTFGELQNALAQDARFLLCNRGVIINMDAVLSFTDGCIRMQDGAQFAVRQKSKHQLFNAFTQYQFRHMKERDGQ